MASPAELLGDKPEATTPAGHSLRVSPLQRSTLAELLRLQSSLLPRSPPGNASSCNGHASDGWGSGAASGTPHDNHHHAYQVSRQGVGLPPPAPPLQPTPRHKMQKCAKPPSKPRKLVKSPGATQRCGKDSGEGSSHSVDGEGQQAAATVSGETKSATGAGTAPPVVPLSLPMIMTDTSTSVDAPDTEATATLTSLQAMKERYRREQADHSLHLRDHVNFRAVVEHGSEGMMSHSTRVNGLGGPKAHLKRNGGDAPSNLPSATTPTGHPQPLPSLRHASTNSPPPMTLVGQSTPLGNATAGFAAGNSHSRRRAERRGTRAQLRRQSAATKAHFPNGGRGTGKRKGILLPYMRLSQAWTLRTSRWLDGKGDRTEGREGGHSLQTDRFCELLSAWNFLSCHVAATRFGTPARTDAPAKASAEATPTPPKLDFKSALIHNIKREDKQEVTSNSGKEQEEAGIVARRSMEIFPAGLPTTLALEEVRRQRHLDSSQLSGSAGSRSGRDEEEEEEGDVAYRQQRSGSASSLPPSPDRYVRVCVTQRGVTVVGTAPEVLPTVGSTETDPTGPSDASSYATAGVYERLHQRQQELAELNRSGRLSASLLRALLNDALLAVLARAPVCPTLDQLITQLEGVVREKEKESSGRHPERGRGAGDEGDYRNGGFSDLPPHETTCREEHEEVTMRYTVEHLLSDHTVRKPQQPSEEGQQGDDGVAADTAPPYEILGLSVEACVLGTLADATRKDGQESEEEEAAPLRTVDLVTTIFARVHDVSSSSSSSSLPPSQLRRSPCPASLLETRTEDEVDAAVARSLVLELFPKDFILSPSTNSRLVVTPLAIDSDGDTAAASTVGDSSYADRSQPTYGEEGETEAGSASAVAQRQRRRDTNSSLAVEEKEEEESGEAGEGPHPIPWPVAEYTVELNTAVEWVCAAQRTQQHLLATLAADWGVIVPGTAPVTSRGADGKGGDKAGGNTSAKDTGSLVFDAERNGPFLTALASAGRVAAALTTAGLPDHTWTQAAERRQSQRTKPAAVRGSTLLQQQQSQNEDDTAAFALQRDMVANVAGFYALLRESSQAHVCVLLAALDDGDEGGSDAKDGARRQGTRGERLLEAVADTFRAHAVDIDGLSEELQLRHQQKNRDRGSRRGKTATPSRPGHSRESVVAAAPSAELLPAFSLLRSASSETTARPSTVILLLPDDDEDGSSSTALCAAVHSAVEALGSFAAKVEAVNEAIRAHLAHDWPDILLPALVARCAALKSGEEALREAQAACRSAIETAAAAAGGESGMEEGGADAPTPASVPPPAVEDGSCPKPTKREKSEPCAVTAAPAHTPTTRTVVPPATVTSPPASSSDGGKGQRTAGKGKKKPQQQSQRQHQHGPPRTDAKRRGGGTKDRDEGSQAGKEEGQPQPWSSTMLTVLVALLAFVGAVFLLSSSGDPEAY